MVLYPQVRKCRVCGKEFQVFSPLQNRKTYCSKECKQKRYEIPVVVKKCLWCHEPITVKARTPTTHQQLYCSKECASNYRTLKKRIVNLHASDEIDEATFNKLIKELEEKGKNFRFPKRFDNLNHLYNLKVNA